MAMCSMFSIIGISFLQMETPSDLIGKVIALTMSAANVALPVGQLVYGVGFDAVSVPVLAVCVVLVMLVISVFAAKTFRKEFGTGAGTGAEPMATPCKKPASETTSPQ